MRVSSPPATTAKSMASMRSSMPPWPGRMEPESLTPAPRLTGCRIAVMDALAEKLDSKLRTWKPATAAVVRERVAEMIELADEDVLDLRQSRAREQEVLDILDEPPTR